MKTILLLLSTCLAALADVPRWSVQEITLTASGRYNNPYTDARVSATFTGPGGVSHEVGGFWYEGNTFKIRFTPTAEGRWTYVTRSADKGLNNQKGSLTCNAPKAGNHGFIRRDADHPHHFMYDDGTRYFMLGTTYYGILSTAIAGDTWKQAIDSCAHYGITKIRFRVNIKLCKNSTQPGPCSSVWGSDGKDHDQLNPAHLRLVDEVLTYMNERGIVADLMPFDSQESFYGTDEQDLRYLRYLMARYASYPNVIWCLTNEFQRVPNKPREFWNTAGTIIRQHDPYASYKQNLRPLSIHPFGGQSNGAQFQFHDQPWPVHVILQSGRFVPADTLNVITLRNRGHNMPIVNDEFGYFDDDIREWGKGGYNQTVHRNALWSIYLAGGYATIGDKAQYADGKPYHSAIWHPRPEYADLKHLNTFFTKTGLPYWAMEPANTLVSAGERTYALATGDGKMGIVYAAAGGTAQLLLPYGTYTAHLLDPRTGRDTALPNWTGGQPVTLTCPDTQDWVVYFRRSGQGLAQQVSKTVKD
ncbi:DUF5060 domain-containing protein [Spirosoma montaniterrae]|uniref:DUF5060 domain-containing protein n=1 Tax=Spirosoma montaniterrae TaxID=1178516 RepID=UPI0009FB7658|nr:DUF5060 domain-containing protein [Spirosoma montaniterrae]